MIEANGIYKSFGNVDVIKGIDLHIDKGEIVTIMGASGAGKSTLLQIIGTLEKADKGEVSINGQNISRLGQKALATFRNKNIGFVFQFHHLLPEFTAIENICIPAYIAGVSKKEANEKARRGASSASASSGDAATTATGSGFASANAAVGRTEPSVRTASANSAMRFISCFMVVSSVSFC